MTSLFCKMEILNVLFVQNRDLTVQESGMLNHAGNSQDLAIKGKRLRKEPQRCSVGKSGICAFHIK